MTMLPPRTAARRAFSSDLGVTQRHAEDRSSSVHLQTGSSATGLSEATVGHSGRSCPVRRSAMGGYVALDLARCMRHADEDVRD
jgi:hypothetical protein